MGAPAPYHLRIFLSSPGDVAEERRLAREVIAELQQQAWLELSCVLADTQKARARQAADHALALARRLEGPTVDRFVLYHALCRAASAAAQGGDLAAARSFYEGLGWRTNAAPDDDVVFFQAGGMVVALWSRSELATDSVSIDCPAPSL